MELRESALQPEAFLRQLPPRSGPDSAPGSSVSRPVSHPDAEPGALQPEPEPELRQPRHGPEPGPAAGGSGPGVAAPLRLEPGTVPLRHHLPGCPRLAPPRLASGISG